MPEGDLIKLIVLQLPNFLGLLIALYLMREQNKSLMELIRECNEQKALRTSESTSD